MIVPDGVNLTAFEIRLITTWIRRSRSPTTGGRSSATAITMLGPSRSSSDEVAAVARAMTSAMATVSRRHSIRPASILARSSVSLISAVSRSPSSTMIPRFSEIWRIARSRFASPGSTAGKTTSSSRRRISLEKPTIEVSGVRSSWLTFERNEPLASDAASAAIRAACASSIAVARAAVRSTTRCSRTAFWLSTSAYRRAFTTPAAMRLPIV